jgi:hypothetical protein
MPAIRDDLPGDELVRDGLPGLAAFSSSVPVCVFS